MAVFDGILQEHQHQQLDKRLSDENEQSPHCDQNNADLGEEEHRIADHHKDGGQEVQLFTGHPLGEGLENHQCQQLRHPDDRRQNRIHILIAVNVLHIIDGHGGGAHVANIEKRHGKGRPQQLVVFGQNLPHPAQGGLFLLPAEHILAFLHPEKGKQLEQQHQNGNGQRHGEPCLGGIAQPGGNRLPPHHDGKHTDIGADTGKGAHFFTGFLLHRKGGQHGPVGNIIQPVKNIPQNIGNGKYRNKPVIPQTEIGKQYKVAGAARQSAQRHRRLKAPVAGTGIIHQQPHDRVIERIKNTQHGKYHTGGNKHAQRQVKDIGKIVDEGIGLQGVEHIPPDGAKAEENHISSIQLVHLVSSSSFSPSSSTRYSREPKSPQRRRSSW